MSTFEILALTTDEAKRRLLRSLVENFCLKVTHFSVGNQGHDPVDPFNALTPDVSLLFPTDQVIFPPRIINSVIEDESSELFPTFQLVLPAGVATGVLSSVYLWSTVFNDPEVEAELNANDPPYTSIEPPPAGFLPLTPELGVPRFEDLPTAGNDFGDKRNVALTDLDYYWNGTTWKVIHEKFLFGIANTPRTIKFEAEESEFRISLQF